MSKGKLNAVDLFAGLGGFTEGGSPLRTSCRLIANRRFILLGNAVCPPVPNQLVRAVLEQL